MSPAKNRGPFVILLLVALVILGITLTGKRDGESVDGPLTNKRQVTLIAISPHTDAIKTEFRQAFRKWSAENLDAEVTIEWRDHGGTIQSLRYVIDRFEGSPAGIDHDIFFGGGVDPFMEFKRRGLLEPVQVDTAIMARIPATHEGMQIYDKDMTWFGACMSGFGILYNKKFLRRYDLPEPTTWQDLGNKDYFGYISSGDMQASGSVHMAYEIMFQGLGWDAGWSLATRIAGNSSRFEEGASNIINTVKEGSAACGMAIDYYAMGAIQELGRQNAGFVLPENLTVINPDGLAVLKGAPNMKYAKAFVQFVLSDAGQKLWVLKPGISGGPEKEGLYRKSIVPGFADQFGDNALTGRDPFTYKSDVVFDSPKASKRWSVFSAMLKSWTVEPHAEVRAAWEAVKDLPDDNPRKVAFLATPVTEAEIEAMLPKWDDDAFRKDTGIRWLKEARAKYNRIAEDN